MHKDKKLLRDCNAKINDFLKTKLALELHPQKTKIFALKNGVGFLGFRIFYFHKLIRKQNIRKFERKFDKFRSLYIKNIIPREKVVEFFESWLAHISHADTYKYRRHLIRVFNQNFPINPKVEIFKNKKNKNFIKKTKISYFSFSSQKTLQLFKKGSSIKEIAIQRNIKESTVWQHLAMLIEYNQLAISKILPKEKINKILPHINSPTDRLKDIKERINDPNISFDEINCVLAHFKIKRKSNTERG